jgi:hypothetical protein
MKTLFRYAALLALFLSTYTVAQAEVMKDHPGYWQGDLKIPNGPTIKVGIEFFIRADGSYWASSDSPDQDSYDIPVQSIHETGEELVLEMSSVTFK